MALIALAGCSNSLPAQYNALKTKYLPEADSLAQASVARCDRADGKRGPNPAAGTALERDPTVLDVEANCWAKGSIEFALGDDPAHGSSLKALPNDIPKGVFGKKRFMVRAKSNQAPDAEWIDVPDGEPSSKIVSIYSQRPTAKGYVSVRIDLREPNG
jgi:hypothetical protein